MLSRVDGTSSVAQIAEETGRPLDEVTALIERLVTEGALTLEEPQRPPERQRSPAPAPRTSGAFRLQPIVETTVTSDVKHPAASLYDPAELDEDVEIDVERRRRILDLFYKLDQLTHYQLFGVDPSVDKKAIKAAYFEVVNVFHPDRYYGKKVGSFKPKLEKVFARLTESYDVLSRNQSRTDYDAYLRAQSKTRAFDAGQLDNDAHQAALQEVMQRIQQEASAENRGLSLPPLASMPPASSGEPAPQSQSSARQSSNPSLRPSASMRPSDPEVRRRALARKLGRSPLPSGSESATGPADEAAAREQLAREDAQRKEWAAEELKRRYQDRVQAARDRQVEVYTRAAKQALDKGDNVGAANALRIAVSLSPSDNSLADQLSEVSGRAKQELSASYLEQAEYEERDEKWLAAAQSYTRALAGRPEARIYDKIAACLLNGEGNLREAGDMAKRAVMAEPSQARYRVTLARFYAKAGMKQSAEGELSRAATLAPSDDKVADWIRRLKRELG